MQQHHSFSEFVWSLGKVWMNKVHQTKWRSLCCIFKLCYQCCRCIVGNRLQRHILFVFCPNDLFFCWRKHSRFLDLARFIISYIHILNLCILLLLLFLIGFEEGFTFFVQLTLCKSLLIQSKHPNMIPIQGQHHRF